MANDDGFAPVPRFLYGTAWKEEATRACVLSALEAGFRGIDTANQRRHYHEAGVGEALQEAYDAGVITREALFLQTKFTPRGGQDHRLPYDAGAPPAEQVQQSFASSLGHLRTDRLEAYVLHGPHHPTRLTDTDWEVWGAMESLHDTGQVRDLGVSNVNLEQLRALCEGARVKPAFVQNRCFARTQWDQEIREYARAQGITYQGFSLLTANTHLTREARFREIVERTGYTPAQVIFAFALQIGMLPLTGTTDRAHMQEDLAALALTLPPEDLQALEA